MSTLIKMLKAGIGDAFIIEVKEKDESFTMVVDGGPRNTMREVLPQIEALEKIDMMVLTHYDSDHISGILEYLTNNESKAKSIRKYWVNCPHIRVRLSSKTSSNEASNLRSFFQKLETECKELDWCEEVLQGVKYISPNGLVKIEVITPTVESRRLNEEKFDKDQKREKISTVRAEKDFEKSLNELAKIKTPSSKQVVNNSSITFLMTTPDCKLLMLGDAKSDDVYKYLTELRKDEKFSKEHKLKVDYVKVPHHGSRYNLTSELLDIIDCDKFLISTCGGEYDLNGDKTKYILPDRMTIAKILLHQEPDRRRQVLLYFNYKESDYKYLFHTYELEDTSLNFKPEWNTQII